MNILFCTTYRVSEQKGGTERITARIAQALREKGHRCFSAYKTEIAEELPLAKWDGELNATNQSLEDYILDNHIDVIIIQKMTREVKQIYLIREKHHLHLKIISALHFAPAYEEIVVSFRHAWHTLKTKCNLKNGLRFLLFPIYKVWYPLRNKELYKTVYKYSDKVVLLSNRFIQEYMDYAGITNNEKFIAIPNALSYDEFLPIENIKNKKKQALVVSRLVETPKRISYAIKAWAEVEKDARLNDWTIKIVGSGPAEDSYKELANKLGIKRIEFCGRQQPKPYYEESSLFLMTSSYEGWGLTLTEAQQFGCVPIAFDSYSSIHDIIINGENGFLIENNNIQLFTEKLKLLMKDLKMLNVMAKEAISSSRRFELYKIICHWTKLIETNK